jgi:DNA-binding SARP family transcriptional activator
VGNTELVEVRLLGGLHITLPDGRLVGETALRTTRSADLLRVLALDAGKPVSVAALTERFWPDTEASRAKASLRTALTHIRGAIGRDTVRRSTAGLSLHQAWVDVSAYRMLASDARTSVRTGRHAPLVRLAREAESLYVADFEASDDTAPWAVGARASLAGLRKAMLSDAAESAVELRWFRDAVDFAESAVAADPGLERAHRALMRAYAGLGETDRALRAFERCRRNLAASLGADPSPLTMSVHLDILSHSVPASVEGRAATREAEVVTLGRSGHQHTAAAGQADRRPRRRTSDHPHPSAPTPEPLSREGLTELAEVVLAGRVSPGLVDHLESTTGSDARRAVAALRSWSAVGSIVWTTEGLEVVSEDSGWEEEPGLGRRVREMQRHLTQLQIELMQAIALLDRPVGADELAPLAASGLSRADARRLDITSLEVLLDQLTDIGALRVSARGYQLRHPRLRDATVTWMRPTARRRMQRRLVEADLVDSSVLELA